MTQYTFTNGTGKLKWKYHTVEVVSHTVPAIVNLEQLNLDDVSTEQQGLAAAVSASTYETIHLSPES